MTSMATGLSERQLTIMRHAAHGMTIGQIARQTNWSERTVKNELGSVCERLQARNVTHAVYLVTRAGLLG